MKEINSETVTTPPKIQKLERLRTIEKEHKDALERAVSLNIPHAVKTPDSEPKEAAEEVNHSEDQPEQRESKSAGGATNWDEVVKKLFKKTGTGDLVVNKEVNVES